VIDVLKEIIDEEEFKTELFEQYKNVDAFRAGC